MRYWRRTLWLRFWVWVVLALLLSACGAQPAPSGAAPGGSSQQPSGGAPPAQPLKIGILLPYTGSLAWYGQELGRGYELAIKKVNAAGGVKGRKIEMVKADAPEATASVAEIDRLKGQGINVVIGTGSSAVALAASAATEKNGMVLWETNALDNGLTSRNFKLVFQFAPNNDSFTEASMALFQSLAPKLLNKQLTDLTVALVYENSAYGTGQRKIQKAKLDSAGIRVVSDQRYDRKASDLSPVVLQLKNANPDVVIETGYQDDIVLFWRQAKELGYLPKMVISSGAAATQDFATALGTGGVDGIIAYNYPFHEMPESGAPGAAEFAKAYAAAYSAPAPSGHSLAAYAGMLALAEVMSAAGSDDPQAVAAAARQLDKPWGAYPNGAGLKFTEAGRNERSRAHGFQWQNGKMFTIWPESVANGQAKGPLVPWNQR